MRTKNLARACVCACPVKEKNGRYLRTFFLNFSFLLFPLCMRSPSLSMTHARDHEQYDTARMICDCRPDTRNRVSRYSFAFFFFVQIPSEAKIVLFTMIFYFFLETLFRLAFGIFIIRLPQVITLVVTFKQTKCL